MSAHGALVFVSLLALMLAQTNIPALEAGLVQGRWAPLILLAAWPVGRWALRSGWEGPSIRRLRGFDYWVMGWVGLAMFSSTYSIAPNTTFLVSGTLVLMYGGVFWGMWLYANRFGESQTISLLLVAVTVVLGGSWFAYGTGIVPTTVGGRFQGILGNPNSLGMLMAFLLPIAMARALTAKHWSLYVLVGGMVGTLLYTGNRGGIIGAAAALLYLFWKGGRVGKKGIAATLVLAVGGVVYSLQGAVETTILRPAQLETGSGRLLIWELMIEFIQNRPWWGHGWGTEDLLYAHYGTPTEALGIRGSYAANSYIGIATQVGVVMAAAFFVPLFWIAGTVALQSSRGDVRLHAFNAVLIAGLILALTESWMSSVGNAQAMPFWIAVMLLVRRRYGPLASFAQFGRRRRHS